MFCNLEALDFNDGWFDPARLKSGSRVYLAQPTARQIRLDA
jgi:hypothetical protein